VTLAARTIDGASPWAILPIKSMQSAKQRLRTILTTAERQSLFQAMVSDVIAAIGQATGLGGLAIVTRDPSVRSLTRHSDARFIQCDLDQGQSLAVAAAAKTLEAEGVTRVVTIPGDVPLLTGAEIDSLCSTLEHKRTMSLVPNRDGTGTNSIACSLPCAIPLSFGESSLHKHLTAARNRGLQTRVVRLPGLSLDLDVCSDLVEFLKHDVRTASRTFLLDSGIAHRICTMPILESACEMTGTDY
jgi:2-phospho-L-lactate guanylyltransferase